MKDTIGFSYSESKFANINLKTSMERAIFRLRKRFPEYIWNDSVSEGKAYTYPLVKTILDGTTTGGSKISEELDIINQRKSLEKLISMVREGKFNISHSAFCTLHDIAAYEEALEWGAFRTGSVGVAGANYSPPPAHKLHEIYKSGIEYIRSIDNVLEKSMIFFLFGAYHQFFYDVNKRTSRLMMNGILMSNGWDSLIIDANQRSKYNQKMLTLYNTKNADEIIDFMINCYRFQDSKRYS